MKRRPGNRIEGAAGCPSWYRPLRPLFHFLDDVSYPQSVQNVCSGRFYLNLTSLRHTVRGTVVINHAESGAFCLFASSFAIRTRRSRIDQRSTVTPVYSTSPLLAIWSDIRPRNPCLHGKLGLNFPFPTSDLTCEVL